MAPWTTNEIAEKFQQKNKEIERLKKEKQYLIELFCNQGVQYCHLCEDKNCGDNLNKH